MKISVYIFLIVLTAVSCMPDLLHQEPTDQISTAGFWQTTNDAKAGVSGVYDGMKAVFRRQYKLDCSPQADLLFGWGFPSNLTGDFWNPCFTAINRANNTIANLRTMYNRANPEDTKTRDLLKRYEAETRFLRGLHYALLIDLYGDIPFMSRVLNQFEAYSVTRTPIAQVRDSIVADYNFAINHLPASYTGSDVGRVTKPAVYAFRGKLYLYWACWKKNGRPEITGFTADAAEAQEYYQKAANDFEEVMKPAYNFSLFKDGEPGAYLDPNYRQLFEVQNEKCSEIIFSVQFAGPNLGQGEDLAFRFGNRNAVNGWCSMQPTHRLVDLYQKTSTGEHAPPLILSNNTTLEGGSSNPKSYEKRDYRMRATVLWDYQKMRRLTTDGKTIGDSIPFLFGQRDGTNYINYDACKTGYIFRKFVRQYAGYEREDGPQDFYLMRLADVWLMYCEAKNEVNGGPTADLYDYIDKIRKRGALPPLNKANFSTKETFFEAIKQERAVELIAEGHRFFDIRRWRIAEQIWNYPTGKPLYDSRNAFVENQFLNANDRTFPRYYIYQIPEDERIKNPNLTQNEPWL